VKNTFSVQPATLDEIDIIAAMHVDPDESLIDSIIKRNDPRYRFYRDKVKLFQSLDPNGVLVAKKTNVTDNARNIAGFIIVTHDTPKFKRDALFRGHALMMAIKTLTFNYGFESSFLKKMITIPYATLGIQKVRKKTNSDIVLPPSKIWAVIVMNNYRGQGIGKLLLDASYDYLKSLDMHQVWLTVELNNTVAQNVYEKSDFKSIGELLESTGHSKVMIKDF